MNNDLSVGHYVGVVILTMIIIAIAIYSVFLIIYNTNNNIKYMKITEDNYKIIYEKVNSTNEITLQEKANFNKNYLLFGKKIIGYKVKDIIKEVQI